MRSTLSWQQAWASARPPPPALSAATLDAAYAQCGEITADYAKTFYLVRGVVVGAWERGTRALRGVTSGGEFSADPRPSLSSPPLQGTKLMTPDKAKAIWSIYVWCRRTDELVDGPNAPRMTPAALDRWDERLTALFEGRPYDVLDAALADTVARFPVDVQPFRDMVGKGGGAGVRTTLPQKARMFV